ncbi:hypothetical protein HMPREF1544_01347 [Mucor circinelloides 1006PhL]|uniref:Uncharacterized protein n=1 Tax=Mucor circinelloides f. circinelloides (strain 1006PhL) TaxID=1220926 RepID=S2JPH1_MUCC1|nr:hypothetical protein HMPREF1544_01347 [Mucor circinelloides 1006PhL]
MFKSILTFMLAALAMVVVADQIYIYGPPSNGIYHPKDIMDIRYHVRSVGMTKIWQTSATLIHESTNATIASFPPIAWNASAETNNAHTTWTVPVGLPNGNYTMTISGNATRLCSKNSDGSAPFTQCQATLYEYRSFVINNGTQTA